MNKLTIKGTIPSFSDKNSIVKLSIEVSDEKINLDELKRLLDKELVISLDDSQAQLDEFIDEAVDGEEEEDDD